MEKEIVEVKLGQKLRILCNNRRSYTGTLEYTGTTERQYTGDYIQFVFTLVSNESVCGEELNHSLAANPSWVA